MGVETYRVRALRLVKHLQAAHGLHLTTSQGLAAIAAEEAVPRADWNILAARAKTESYQNRSELVLGAIGSGKTTYVHDIALQAALAGRAVLTLSTTPGELRQLLASENYTGDAVYEFHWTQAVRRTPTLKDLGFTKPQARDIVIIADEMHSRLRQLHVWFLDLLSMVTKHEGVTVLVVAQDGDPHIWSYLDAARITRARLFGNPYLKESSPWASWSDGTVSVVRGLRPGESVLREIRVSRASQYWRVEEAPKG